MKKQKEHKSYRFLPTGENISFFLLLGFQLELSFEIGLIQQPWWALKKCSSLYCFELFACRFESKYPLQYLFSRSVRSGDELLVSHLKDSFVFLCDGLVYRNPTKELVTLFCLKPGGNSCLFTLNSYISWISRVFFISDCWSFDLYHWWCVTWYYW